MLILNALLRGGIPFIIMSSIALILYFQGKYTDAKGTFIASLIAFLVGAATVIYTIDSWSLTKQSVVHFLVMLITVYPTLLFSGWFTITSVADALKVLLIFIAVGIVLWIVMFAIATIFS